MKTVKDLLMELAQLPLDMPVVAIGAYGDGRCDVKVELEQVVFDRDLPYSQAHSDDPADLEWQVGFDDDWKERYTQRQCVRLSYGKGARD